jgi:hypothetical protein
MILSFSVASTTQHALRRLRPRRSHNGTRKQPLLHTVRAPIEKREGTWLTGNIVAYAVLGGCYDDPVVDIVSSTILKQGFIVGTFNFRSVPHIWRIWRTYANFLRLEEGQALQKAGLRINRNQNRVTICPSLAS